MNEQELSNKLAYTRAVNAQLRELVGKLKRDIARQQQELAVKDAIITEYEDLLRNLNRKAA